MHVGGIGQDSCVADTLEDVADLPGQGPELAANSESAIRLIFDDLEAFLTASGNCAQLAITRAQVM